MQAGTKEVAQDGNAVLTVSDISKSFRRQPWLPWSGVHHVLRGVSFALKPSTLVGLVGENGSGHGSELTVTVEAT